MTEIENQIYQCLFEQGLTVKKTSKIVGYCERQIYRIKKKLKEVLENGV